MSAEAWREWCARSTRICPARPGIIYELIWSAALRQGQRSARHMPQDHALPEFGHGARRDPAIWTVRNDPRKINIAVEMIHKEVDVSLPEVQRDRRLRRRRDTARKAFSTAQEGKRKGRVGRAGGRGPPACSRDRTSAWARTTRGKTVRLFRSRRLSAGRRRRPHRVSSASPAMNARLRFSDATKGA